MIKRRMISAAYFTLAMMGLYFFFLIVYYLLSNPETITWYESIMTLISSIFVTNWLERRSGL